MPNSDLLTTLLDQIVRDFECALPKAADREDAEQSLWIARQVIAQAERLIAERDEANAMLACYRWRPISEINEDYCPCIAIPTSRPRRHARQRRRRYGRASRGN
jgi:hypothetical protein